MLIGRWHFEQRMLKPNGRFDWNSPTPPFPSVSKKDALARLYPPERQHPVARAIEGTIQQLAEAPATPSVPVGAAAGHLKRLRDSNDDLAHDNDRLRAALVDLQASQEQLDTLHVQQQAALQELSLIHISEPTRPY
eukprot:TRINITY_DN34450_c0_g1_i2.p2 TRINITY_DN34450_c0_g1~~TRINITY_DN34450_c0_g1_i2.p2  ORF type:complete len:136 (-),score=25.37 TRINITY_DN34450_c0_g1_i2:48-455(-)